MPGTGLKIPIWLLGSGGFSAQLAGELGLPFASAGHFSPDSVLPALELYRRKFRPSADLDRPYAMVGINVFAAETDSEAERLATSHLQAHLQLAQGRPIELPPPVNRLEEVWKGPSTAYRSSEARLLGVRQQSKPGFDRWRRLQGPTS